MKSKRHFDKPFQLYHLSEQNLDGKTLEPRPLDPMRAMDSEDWRVPRICVSTSIDGAVSSLLDSVSCPFGKKFWVHVPTNLEELFLLNKVHRPSTKQVPDAEVTGEHWLKAPTVMKAIGKIEVLDIDEEKQQHFMWEGKNATLDRFKWKWAIMKA